MFDAVKMITAEFFLSFFDLFRLPIEKAARSMNVSCYRSQAGGRWHSIPAAGCRLFLRLVEVKDALQHTPRTAFSEVKLSPIFRDPGFGDKDGRSPSKCPARRGDAREMTMSCCMCKPMGTAPSHGDDTHAVVTRVKGASEHGLHTFNRRNYRTECGPSVSVGGQLGPSTGARTSTWAEVTVRPPTSCANEQAENATQPKEYFGLNLCLPL